MVRTLGVLALLLSVISGCASTASRDDRAGLAPGFDPRAVTVVRGDGSPASWDELVSAASGAEAVLWGETHGHAIGLAACASFWEDLVARAPKAALAMEFFERDEQVAIDDYFKGVTDEQAFRKAASRGKGNYPPGHRSMVEKARELKRLVVAANAPRRYVRLARTEGFERLVGLNDRQRAMFRLPDVLPEGKYRDDFEKIMGNEPAPAPRKHDDMFRSQSVWDWTMAESVAGTIDSGAVPVLLVVGRFHVEHRGGLPQALDHLRTGTRVVSVTCVDASFGERTPEDAGRADFVIYVGRD